MLPWWKNWIGKRGDCDCGEKRNINFHILWICDISRDTDKILFIGVLMTPIQNHIIHAQYIQTSDGCSYSKNMSSIIITENSSTNHSLWRSTIKMLITMRSTWDDHGSCIHRNPHSANRWISPKPWAYKRQLDQPNDKPSNFHANCAVRAIKCTLEWWPI